MHVARSLGVKPSAVFASGHGPGKPINESATALSGPQVLPIAPVSLSSSLVTAPGSGATQLASFKLAFLHFCTNLSLPLRKLWPAFATVWTHFSLSLLNNAWAGDVLNATITIAATRLDA